MPEQRYFSLDDDRRPVRVAAPSHDRPLVAETSMAGGLVTITTAFAGRDLSPGEPDDPWLFATTSLVGADFVEHDVYRTWGEAEAGHEKVARSFRVTYVGTDPAMAPLEPSL